MSVLDTLAAATPSRRSETLCLDSSLQAEWDDALHRLGQAADHDTRRSLADVPAATAVVEEMEALREQMAASEVRFDFERLAWNKRIALQAAHPPREKNPGDMLRGFNTDTYWPALIRACCVAVTGAGGDTTKDIPESTWVSLLGDEDTAGSLNLKQVETLINAANYVNDSAPSVPRSARSLNETRASGASLARPETGESPRNDSEAGNPPTSPKSSTTKKGPSKAKSPAT